MKSLLICLFLFLFSFTISGKAPAKKQSALAYENSVPAPYRAAFVSRVRQMSERLRVQPDWVMTVMRFETAGAFRANIRNPYSGATGLIQFIPSTAHRLGTTTVKLSRMGAVEQLDYVEKYFSPYVGRMNDVYDMYLVVFAPAFLGKADGQVLYRANGKTPLDRRRYRWNRVLDANQDGLITIRDVKRQIFRFVVKRPLNGCCDGIC